MAKKIKIINEKCIFCIGCTSVCPVLALQARGNTIFWDEKKCTRCGLCIKVCPAKALEFIEE